MASTLWRLQGVQTVGGGDLELGELRLWGQSAALDAESQLRSSHAPIVGTLESLRDDSDEATCRWAASDVVSPGFYIEWETATPVDAWCVRFSSPQVDRAIGAYNLCCLVGGAWLVAGNGWVPYTSGLSMARASSPTYPASIGWSQPIGPLADTFGFLGSAVSADGHTVVVTGFGSSAAKVSRSRDGGLTWSQPTGPLADTGGFYGTAVSADGQTVVVVGRGSSAAKVSIGILRDRTYVEAPTRMQSSGLERAITGVPPFAQGYIGFMSLTTAGSDMEFGGDGAIYGTVAIKADPTNTLVKRRVRLRRSRDGLHARETWSNAQGEYRFEGINRQYEYDVEAWDHTGNMRSVLANNVTPEKMT